MNIAQITETAEELLEMVSHYKSLKGRGELGADLIRESVDGLVGEDPPYDEASGTL